MKDFEDMNEEERKEYFEDLGMETKKVEEHEGKENGVDVVEDSGKDEEKEERREEELEQYRETSGF